MTATAPSTPHSWRDAPRWPRVAAHPSHRPILHGDNGASFKATTVLAMLHWLGIKPLVLADLELLIPPSPVIEARIDREIVGRNEGKQDQSD
jgi:hypothetical protein